MHFMLFTFKPKQLVDQAYFLACLEKKLTETYNWPEFLLDAWIKIRHESYTVVKDWRVTLGLGDDTPGSKMSEDIQHYDIPKFTGMTVEDYRYVSDIVAMRGEMKEEGRAQIIALTMNGITGESHRPMRFDRELHCGRM